MRSGCPEISATNSFSIQAIIKSVFLGKKSVIKSPARGGVGPQEADSGHSGFSSVP